MVLRNSTLSVHYRLQKLPSGTESLASVTRKHTFGVDTLHLWLINVSMHDKFNDLKHKFEQDA